MIAVCRSFPVLRAPKSARQSACISSTFQKDEISLISDLRFLAGNRAVARLNLFNVMIMLVISVSEFFQRSGVGLAVIYDISGAL
jgi:hypothetical protein